MTKTILITLEAYGFVGGCLLPNHHTDNHKWKDLMSTKNYKSRDEELFFDYLPDEVFNSLTESERIHYREYRRYHHLVNSGKKKIEKYQNQIKKLNQLIKVERFKLKGGKNRDGDTVWGWDSKLKDHYSIISRLDEQLRLNVTTELRTRKSKSLIVKQNPKKRGEFQILKKTYKQKELTELKYLYGKVTSVDRNHKFIFYFGPVESIREKLFEIIGDESKKLHVNRIRYEVMGLMTQYVRYTVFHNGWERIKGEQKNLEVIIDWVHYCNQNGLDRNRWG